MTKLRCSVGVKSIEDKVILRIARPRGVGFYPRMIFPKIRSSQRGFYHCHASHLVSDDVKNSQNASRYIDLSFKKALFT